jgi:hypothetical protein
LKIRNLRFEDETYGEDEGPCNVKNFHSTEEQLLVFAGDHECLQNRMQMVSLETKSADRIDQFPVHFSFKYLFRPSSGRFSSAKPRPSDFLKNCFTCAVATEQIASSFAMK